MQDIFLCHPIDPACVLRIVTLESSWLSTMRLYNSDTLIINLLVDGWHKISEHKCKVFIDFLFLASLSAAFAAIMSDASFEFSVLPSAPDACSP
eukprot:4740845-Amphidinium_carterae.1